MSRELIRPLIRKYRVLDGVSDEWLAFINKDKLERIIERVIDNVKGDVNKICPPLDKCFEAFRRTPFRSVSVVIVGQDPYYTPGQADGLAFSCRTGRQPSLVNILKCIVKSGLAKESNTSFNLSYLTERGVLLINKTLTTAAGSPNKHESIWGYFIPDLVEKFSGETSAIWMLWGKNAKELRYFIAKGRPEAPNKVLTWVHPSPMAQSGLDEKDKFVNCDHFTIASVEKGIKWGYSLDEYKTASNVGLPSNAVGSSLSNAVGSSNASSVASSAESNENSSTSKKQSSTKKDKVSSKKGDSKKSASSDSSDSDSDPGTPDDPDMFGLKYNYKTDTAHIVFTDGSCNPNNKSAKSRAGYAAVFVAGPNAGRVFYGSMDSVLYEYQTEQIGQPKASSAASAAALQRASLPSKQSSYSKDSACSSKTKYMKTFGGSSSPEISDNDYDNGDDDNVVMERDVFQTSIPGIGDALNAAKKTTIIYPSNIRAEGYAIIKAMTKVLKSDVYNCEIVTDSQFWISMVDKYMPKWDGATFETKENPDLTRKMHNLACEIRKRGVLKLTHVRSHNRNGKTLDKSSFDYFAYLFNDYADHVCDFARKNLKMGEEVSYRFKMS